jgi:hypothetical protein
MDIVKQTPTQITFSNSDSVSFIQILGGLFLVVGNCLIKVIPGKVVNSLICNRIGANQGTCQIGSSGVMVISEANQKSKLTIWRGNYRN